jgi:hypothetical protein
LARALEHKDRLLEYERTSARRTVIYGTQFILFLFLLQIALGDELSVSGERASV